MRVKCPECEKEGKRSRVYPGPTSSQLRVGDSYYDEEGRYHNHDPNWKNTSYTCSNGHAWTRTYRVPCPAVGCDYNKDEAT